MTVWFFAGFAAAAWLAERYSLEHVLDRVHMGAELSRTVVEPGEEFFWTLYLENGKRLMVPYLQVREQVPEGLEFSESGRPAKERGEPRVTSTLYLGGGQKAVLKRKVILRRRGRYFFRGIQAEAGDFLGLKTVMENVDQLKEIVVKPSPAEFSGLSEVLSGFLGEFQAERSLFEDAILIRGFREYTGSEPFRAISWTQSARYNRILVKKFERTADLACTVLLDVAASRDGGCLERCFSMVRTICEELERRRIPYDFGTNGVIAGAMGNWRRVEEGMGAGHLETVLEGLGRMTYGHQESSGEFYDREIRRLLAGRSVILVTSERTREAMEAAARMEKRTGRRVLLLDADGKEA